MPASPLRCGVTCDAELLTTCRRDKPRCSRPTSTSPRQQSIPPRRAIGPHQYRWTVEPTRVSPKPTASRPTCPPPSRARADRLVHHHPSLDRAAQLSARRCAVDHQLAQLLGRIKDEGQSDRHYRRGRELSILPADLRETHLQLSLSARVARPDLAAIPPYFVAPSATGACPGPDRRPPLTSRFSKEDRAPAS